MTSPVGGDKSPRTDALVLKLNPTRYDNQRSDVDAIIAFARQLERELAEERERAETYRNGAMKMQLDSAQRPSLAPTGDSLKALSDAATPGVWKVTGEQNDLVQTAENVPVARIVNTQVFMRGGKTAGAWAPNADFIVALVNAYRSAPSPLAAPITAEQFDIIVSKITTRMCAHTIPEDRGAAWHDFVMLLRQVKPDECGVATPPSHTATTDALGRAASDYLAKELAAEVADLFSTAEKLIREAGKNYPDFQEDEFLAQLKSALAPSATLPTEKR